MFFIEYVLSTVINKEETSRKSRLARRQAVKQQHLLLREANYSLKRNQSGRSTVMSPMKKSKIAKPVETLDEEENDSDSNSINLSEYMAKEREIICECAEKLDRLTNVVMKCNKRTNMFASTLNATMRNKGNSTFRNNVDFDFSFIKNKLKKISMKELDNSDGECDDELEDDEDEKGGESEDDNFHASILKHYPEAHDKKFMQNVHLVLGELRNGNNSTKSSKPWNETHESGFV